MFDINLEEDKDIRNISFLLWKMKNWVTRCLSSQNGLGEGGEGEHGIFIGKNLCWDFSWPNSSSGHIGSAEPWGLFRGPKKYFFTESPKIISIVNNLVDLNVPITTVLSFLKSDQKWPSYSPPKLVIRSIFLKCLGPKNGEIYIFW